MILFRLLNFALRVIGSFLFVFLLQIQFAGKTLETYLTDFSKKFFVTKTLQKVSEDGTKFIKGFSSSEGKKSREISSSKAAQYIKDVTEQIKLPGEALKEEKDSSE